MLDRFREVEVLLERLIRDGKNIRARSTLRSRQIKGDLFGVKVSLTLSLEAGFIRGEAMTYIRLKLKLNKALIHAFRFDPEDADLCDPAKNMISLIEHMSSVSSDDSKMMKFYRKIVSE